MFCNIIHYLIVDLSPEYLYNISVMAKNKFDGRKAYVSSVALTSHRTLADLFFKTKCQRFRVIDIFHLFCLATLSIISIGGTIVAQEGMRVLMDCLVVGYPPVDWTFDVAE